MGRVDFSRMPRKLGRPGPHSLQSKGRDAPEPSTCTRFGPMTRRDSEEWQPDLSTTQSPDTADH